MHLKISSAKWQPFCPGGDELKMKMRGNKIWRLIVCHRCYSCLFHSFQWHKWQWSTRADNIIMICVDWSLKVKRKGNNVCIDFRIFLQSDLDVHSLHSSPFLLKNPKEGYMYGLTGTREGSNYGLAEHWLCIYQMDGREYSEFTIIYEICNHDIAWEIEIVLHPRFWSAYYWCRELSSGTRREIL